MGVMRVVKVRARPASLLPSRSRVVRSDVRGEFSFSHHEGSRAPSTSFPSLTARAIFPPLLLLSQPDHEWRSASGAHASDVASATTRSLRELDRHPREVSRRRRERAPRPASSSSRVAFGKTVPSTIPASSPSPASTLRRLLPLLVSDALDRSSRAYDSRPPGPGPAPARAPTAAPRDHPRGPIHPRPRPRAKPHARRPNPARGVRVGSRSRSRSRRSPRDGSHPCSHPARARRDYRRGSRSRTELPARSLRGVQVGLLA